MDYILQLYNLIRLFTRSEDHLTSFLFMDHCLLLYAFVLHYLLKVSIYRVGSDSPRHRLANLK